MLAGVPRELGAKLEDCELREFMVSVCERPGTSLSDGVEVKLSERCGEVRRRWRVERMLLVVDCGELSTLGIAMLRGCRFRPSSFRRLSARATSFWRWSRAARDSVEVLRCLGRSVEGLRRREEDTNSLCALDWICSRIGARNGLRCRNRSSSLTRTSQSSRKSSWRSIRLTS